MSIALWRQQNENKNGIKSRLTIIDNKLKLQRLLRNVFQRVSSPIAKSLAPYIMFSLSLERGTIVNLRSQTKYYNSVSGHTGSHNSAS